MKPDEQLKKILATHAVEQTTDDFAAKTMQRINSFADHRSKPVFVKYFQIKHLLVGLFIIVTLALIVTSFFLKPLQLPVEIRIQLPEFLARQFYNLLILIPAFWLLVFINLNYEKRLGS
jgi:hypothetical protein